jgi:hypothetical protein
VFRNLFSGLFRKPRADTEQQQGDVHALDRSDDPRGGVQSDAYRHAGPTEIVEEDGVAMSGPAGAPPADDGS